MSTTTALDGPTHHHGWSGLGPLHPADCDVVWVAVAAGVPDVDVAVNIGPTALSPLAWHFFRSRSG